MGFGVEGLPQAPGHHAVGVHRRVVRGEGLEGRVCEEVGGGAEGREEERFVAQLIQMNDTVLRGAQGLGCRAQGSEANVFSVAVKGGVWSLGFGFGFWV